MLKTISGLQGVTILSKQAQKKIQGSGPCGVKIDGVWYQATDANGSGGTKDETMAVFNGDAVPVDGNGNPISGTVTNWCCASCPWN
jgi:hypothetical protein